MQSNKNSILLEDLYDISNKAANSDCIGISWSSNVIIFAPCHNAQINFASKEEPAVASSECSARLTTLFLNLLACDDFNHACYHKENFFKMSGKMAQGPSAITLDSGLPFAENLVEALQ